MRVKFFPPLDAAVGLAITEVELPQQAAASQLISILKDTYGDALPEVGKMMLTVNKAYAEHDNILHDGDDVTVIPIMSCCHCSVDIPEAAL